MGTFSVCVGVTAVLITYFFFFYMGDELIEVKTKLGKYKGKLLETGMDAKVEAYRGIPYGTVPERFANPEPFGNVYTGVYYASSHGDACMQQPEDEFGSGKDVQYSEKCLYINLWVPHPRKPGREVMVYIHGWNYTSGSGSDAMYDGTVLAMHGDVIVVTFNYRLGVFGFAQLQGPSEEHGNMGLKDQQLALKWVHDHVDSFGGDPNKITIFGQSSGAASVAYHLVLPGSKGLFQRAIMQSMPSLFQGYNTMEDMRKSAGNLGEYFDCDSEVSLLSCLKNISSEELVKGNEISGTHWRPVLDELFLTDPPTDLMHDGKVNDVDVMIGVNKNEGSMFTNMLSEMWTGDMKDDPKAVYKKICMWKTEDVLIDSRRVCEAYSPKDESSVEQLFHSIMELHTDGSFICPANKIANMFANHQFKVHMYYLTYREKHSKYPKYWGVPHMSDLQWVFGEPYKVKPSKKYKQEEKQFAETIMNMWLNFAKSGSPIPGLTPYSSSSPSYVELKSPSKIHHQTGKAIRQHHCNLWQYE